MELAGKERPLSLKRFQPFEGDGLLCVCLRESKPVVVLPESLKDRVILNHHSSYYAGHFDFHKTLKRIKLHFYWPHMKRHVRAFIARCILYLQA